MTKDKQFYDREYLGTIVTPSNYREIVEKEGIHKVSFHKKHLKAYIQGKIFFVHGIRVNEQGEKLGPAFHQVQQKLTPTYKRSERSKINLEN